MKVAGFLFLTQVDASMASGQGLHCLPMTLSRVSR